MRAPITDKHLLEMMWERFPEIMKRGAEQPAQPQQEPVATWLGTDYEAHRQCFAQLCDLEPGTDLYTSPPAQRKPLTDEEIWKFWWSRPEVPDGEDDSMEAEFVAAVRAVLAAHGIKENKK